MRTLERGEQPSQRLLFPMTLHLGPAEGEAFEPNRDVFEQLGFEIEGFGGHTLLVRAVPMPHPRFDAERCLRETLAALTGDRDAGTHARHERLAATVACKAAIKAGDALSPGEMRALFIALRDTTLPAHDVHGRVDDRAAHLGRARAALWRRARDVRVICGPTAAGKSGVAMWLAERAADRRSSAPTRARSIAASTSAPRSRRADERARVSAPRHRRRRADRAILRGGVGRAGRALDRRSARERARHRSSSAERDSTCARCSTDCSRSRRSTRASRAALGRELARARHSTSCGAGCARSIPTRAHLGRTQLLRAIEIALLTGQAHERPASRARATGPRWRAALSCGGSGAGAGRSHRARASTTCSTRAGRTRCSDLMQIGSRRRAGVERDGLRRGSPARRAAS